MIALRYTKGLIGGNEIKEHTRYLEKEEKMSKKFLFYSKESRKKLKRERTWTVPDPKSWGECSPKNGNKVLERSTFNIFVERV